MGNAPRLQQAHGCRMAGVKENRCTGFLHKTSYFQTGGSRQHHVYYDGVTFSGSCQRAEGRVAIMCLGDRVSFLPKELRHHAPQVR